MTASAVSSDSSPRSSATDKGLGREVELATLVLRDLGDGLADVDHAEVAGAEVGVVRPPRMEEPAELVRSRSCVEGGGNGVRTEPAGLLGGGVGVLLRVEEVLLNEC